MIKYGYGRCSTNDEKQDVDRQRRELEALGVKPDNIILEYEHGDKGKQKLDLLLDTMSEGDELITTEVSRLSRSTKQLCDIIDLVKAKKLKLTIQNGITVDCTGGKLDPMSEAFIQIAGVFAQLELSMIRERVKSGMANAKAKGKVIGRPHTTADDIPPIFLKHYPKYKSGELNKKELSRLCGLSYPTIYKYIDIAENKKK